jgi:phosphoribosylanthranilate isomerase
MRVKICGITSQEDAFAAIDAGADALGFVLYPKSPRYITPAAAGRIVRQLPPFIQSVAVTVNATPPEVRDIETVATFDIWQLHGDELPDRCRAHYPRRLIKAVSLPSPKIYHDLSEYKVMAFLLDTSSPQYGGSGKTFDWKLAAEFKAKTDKPIVLSGGLNPENVAQAVEAVHPYAVDVSSGVESAPGKKDHDKLKKFLTLCKTL